MDLIKVRSMSLKMVLIVHILKKEKIISFVGKLNRAKGYDIFGNAVIPILNKYKDWLD